MVKYNILIKKSAAKEIERLPKQDVKRIIDQISMLARDPRPNGCEKLAGHDRYRIRQGKHRIVYAICDSELIVWVVKIAHRKDVYKKF